MNHSDGEGGRKIRNPFNGLPGYNCFGCSPGNDAGLQMNFEEMGEEIVSHWDPQHRFQGYLDLLHGGIQATLMDEIASWTVYVRHKAAGMTSRMSVKYHKPVHTKNGMLEIRSRIVNVRRNLVDIDVRLFDRQGILCSEALVTYFTYSPERSRERLYFPDHSEFFNDSAEETAR